MTALKNSTYIRIYYTTKGRLKELCISVIVGEHGTRVHRDVAGWQADGGNGAVGDWRLETGVRRASLYLAN